jgi:hypothetical protein
VIPAQPVARWTPERLAYWYFRLNGFLTTENFIVHPDLGSNQRTDADLLAVRLAHRSENLLEPMEDDPKVAACTTFTNVVIAEVKTGRCSLNGPWTNPEDENMRRVLKAIGCVPGSALSLATEVLYKKGSWSDTFTTVRLFAMGEFQTHGLSIPMSQQITWDTVINFLIGRFKDYRTQKSSVGQWTQDGQELRRVALQKEPEPEIRRLFGLSLDNSSNQGTA